MGLDFGLDFGLTEQPRTPPRRNSLPDGAFVRTKPDPGHGFLRLGLAHQVLDQRLIGIPRHVDPHARAVEELCKDNDVSITVVLEGVVRQPVAANETYPTYPAPLHSRTSWRWDTHE